MDAEKVDRVEKQLDHHLNNGDCSKCSVKGKDSANCINNLYKDALSVIRELKAENERLRQEKDDAVKRIEHCRQNCISGEKDCDIAYNKSGKELYRAKADAYKQALDIINEPSI